MISTVLVLMSCVGKKTAPDQVAEEFIQYLLVDGDFESALLLTTDDAKIQLKWMMSDKKAIQSYEDLSDVSYQILSVAQSTNEETNTEFASVVLNIKATVNGVKQENEQKLKLKKRDGKWLVGRM